MLTSIPRIESAINSFVIKSVIQKNTFSKSCIFKMH